MKSTQDTWARLVCDEQEIPESFTGFFQKLDTAPGSFPHTVFAPPDRWYRGRTNPKLICLFDDRVYVAEKIKKEIVVHCYPVDQIHYLEMGTMLLYSWLKIYGTVDGQVTSVTVEFSTVVKNLFQPIVEKIRAAIDHLEIEEDSRYQLKEEEAKFNYLMQENYKYMNYGRRSLLPGTEVAQVLLQPDIRAPYWKYFSRTISLIHLTILTDKELIIVKEDDDSNQRRQVRYGGIWRYIPLNKISYLDVTPTLEGDLYTLSVKLPENLTISSLFSAEQKPPLDLLRSNFERLKTEAV